MHDIWLLIIAGIILKYNYDEVINKSLDSL